MLAAATLMAGNAWAATIGECTVLDAAEEGTTFTQVWAHDWSAFTTATGAATNDCRFANADPTSKEILVANKGAKKIYAINESGISLKYELTGDVADAINGMSTGLTVDEAGNVIFYDGWPNTVSNLYLIPKDNAAGLTQLPVTLPNGYKVPRSDAMGRAIGDFTSEDGGFLCIAAGAATPAHPYCYTAYIADSEISDEGCSVTMPGNMTTTGVVVPYYFTVEEQLEASDSFGAVVAFNYNVSSLWMSPTGEDDSYTTPARAGGISNYGFDTFQLYGKTYYVMGAKKAANYESYFVIQDEDGNLVAQYWNGDGTVSSSAYISLRAVKTANNSVDIYMYRQLGESAKFTFTVPSQDAPSVELYATGSGDSWSADNPTVLTADSEGLYHYTLEKISYFKLSTAKGEWNDFNANTWSTAASIPLDGTWVDLTAQVDKNIYVDSFQEGTTVAITIDWANKKIKAEGTASTTHYFSICGDNIGWSPDTYCTSEVTDDRYQSVTVAWTGGTFKAVINKDNWRGNGVTMTNGDWNVIGDLDGGNMLLDASANGNDVTFTWDLQEKALKAEWTSTGPTTYTVAIVGAFNSWNTTANTGTTTTTTCDIVVENYQNAVSDQGEGFKVFYNGQWLGNGNGTTATLSNGVYSNTLVAGSSDDNLLLPDDANGKTVTFTYAIDTNTVRASWGGAVEAPDHVYIIGNVNGNTGWAANNGVELTKDGSTFEGTVTMAGSWFGIATALGSNADDWDGETGLNANRYGAATDGEAIAKDGSSTFAKNTNAWNISNFATDFENSEVKFTVDWANMTVTITAGASGVEGINVDNAADAIYYNLQGVQVAQPANGQVYIRVAGGKASKILF